MFASLVGKGSKSVELPNMDWCTQN